MHMVCVCVCVCVHVYIYILYIGTQRHQEGLVLALGVQNALFVAVFDTQPLLVLIRVNSEGLGRALAHVFNDKTARNRARGSAALIMSVLVDFACVQFEKRAHLRPLLIAAAGVGIRVI